MKKTFILTFFMMLCSITFGRNNPWEGGINPNDFNSSNSVREVEADDVAKIGDEGYSTLADALAAATAGGTITFVADIIEDVTINKAVTIDGAGKTYTGAMTAKADVTVKNLNFDGKGYNGYAITTRGAQNLTIEDCTAKNYGYGFVQLASATDLTTVKNVTVSNMNYGVKVDYSNAVVLENVDITAAVAAVLNSNYGEKTITIKNSDLNILGTWTRDNTTITNYLFEGANTVGKWLIDSAIDNFKLAAGAAFTAPKELAVTTVEGNKVVYLLGKKQYQSVEEDAVAQVGNENYTTFANALAAAEDGDTVTVLEDMEEAVSITNLGKNVTFDGNGNKMTAGIVIGSDNNKLDSDEVTIKNFKFENKGVSVKELLNVTIEDNTFENITGDAILVVSDELTSMITVKDNEINTVAGAGINLRCPISATIEGNTVKNTTGNSITLQKNSKLTDHEGAISIANNVMENWASGKTEGRAIRMALGSAAKTVVVENNAMIKTEAPEEFVKITGYNNNTTISINKNYWNGSSPIEQTTPAKYLADGVSPSNYYASYDATNGLSNLVEVSYVAQVGDVKYATLQDAVKACGAGTSTITLLADCVEDVTVVQAPDTKVTIDGNGKNYTGTITVNGKSAAYETAALTITNVNFDATAIAKDASINLGGSNATRYTSNVTVEGCSFKGEGQAKAAIKNYTGGCKNLVVSNSTAEGLHSLVQVKGVAGLTINEVTVNNCKNGIAVGTSTGVVIKNSNITATGYGVRADGTVETTMTMSGNTIKANLPVVVRETNAAYNLVATGNTFTASNEKGAAVTFTTGDDGTFVAPASDATATITGNVTTFGFEAKVGNVYYTTFDKALAAVDGNTITVISPVVITENNKSYNLTGINVEGDVYPMFRIHNGATVTFEGGNFTNGDYVFTLGEGATDEATSGNLVINGGTYVGETTVANVVKGLLTINGGEFSLSAAYQDNYNFLINCYDATYKNDLANVEIKGGKFHKFNPENNAAEGEGTNFCAEGYEAKHNSSDDTYIVRRKPAGHVAYRADVTDKEDREGIAVLLKEVYAFESLVVKVYNNETLMFTSTRRDIDDENKVMFPVVGANTTANIVLWGKESGSWINKILVEPTELNVPNKIEVWSDGVLVDEYTHDSGTVLGTNIEKYHALDCVKKAVAQVGETKYVYLEDALEACTNGETVTIIRDITYTEADVKNAIGGATGFGQYPNPCIISIGGQKGENGAANIPSSVNAVIDLNGHTLTNNAEAYFFMIMDNAKVVFTDSSEENTGKVITNVDAPAVWVVGTETLVTVKDGYFQTVSEGGVMHSTHGGDLVIEGGEFKTTAERTNLLIMLNSKDRQNSKFFISGVATVTIKGGIFHGFNPSLVGDDNGATSIEDIKFVNGCAEGYGPVKIGENLYGVYSVNTLVAKIGTIYYNTFASALAAVQNGETIELLDIEGNENTEIEFEKAIEFTVTGSAPKYALPVVTFQNATVNIKDATILIPELDARQNATINVINSNVYGAGGDGIVKSYYNGAINIDKTSTVYTMQVTTMGYITVAGTLNATWQTNVYGNGLITLNEGAKFNTAALQLTGKEYSGRDNTDAERVGKPAEIIVNEGANLVVGKVYSSSGADYSYNSSYGVNIGTIDGKSAVLTLNGGNVDIYMADGQNVNIGEDGTVEVGASTMKTICRKEGGTVGINNKGTINFSELSAELHTTTADLDVTTNVKDYSVKYVDGVYRLVANLVLNTNTGDTYATLAEAISAATAGNTIQFLADITENVTISKNVTIDGAGKTYTGQMKLTSQNGTVGIKNVNFDGKGYNGYAIETRGVYYVTIEDCTAANYGYGFVQLASATVLTTVKNVTVSDMNYGVKVDYSNAVVLENVDITAAVAAVLNSNYGEKTITIKNSDLNILGTWTRDNTTKTNYVFEGANTVGKWVIDSAIDNFKLATKESTLTAPNEVTVTTTVADHTVIYFVDTYKVVAKNYVAQIGEGESAQKFESLQDAVNACVAGDNTITLLADCDEDVTVVQAPDTEITIDGNDKNYTGTITVNGKSAAYETAALTIKNVNFDATAIAKDASINLGGSNATRYTSNVTVENCSFTGEGQAKAAIKNYTGGCKNLVVSNSTAEGLHSLVQVKGVAGLTIDNVTIEGGKNGIAVGTSTGVVIKNSIIDVTGYGVRADGTVETTMTMSGNTIKANLPVVVRETNAAYNLVATGNTFTASNEKGAAVTFTTGDDGIFEAPASDATATIEGNVTTFGFEARIDNDYNNDYNVYYTTFDNAYTAAGNGNTITVLNPVVITENNKSYNLTDINVEGDVYPMFRIQNGATVTFEGGNFTNGDYVFTLGEGATDEATSGNLVINGGTYVGETTVANVVKGLLTINGGEFSLSAAYQDNYNFLINCYDATYKNDLANVEIKGGKFHKFNPENNAAEGEGTNFCAEGYSAVETGSDIWTVVPRQSQQLSAGWNWFSSYMSEFDGKDGLAMIQNQLGENGIEVKNHHDGTSRYEAGYGWYGNLKSVNVRSMYMINVAEENPIEIGGAPVTSCTITLKPGWNAIGFPSTESINVADVFAQVQNNDKDYIKSKDQYVAYDGGYWEDGSLQSMEPGKGYMYYNAGTTDQTLVFPIAKSRGEVRANMTTEGNYWVANGASFANNMTMTAVLNVNGVEMTDNYEVAAFAGEEVRGSARPVYVESIDRYVMFMTIYGEGNEELTFKYIDLDTYEVHNLNDMVVYADNAMLGSLRKPIELCYGTMGIGENGFDTMSLYPNPTRTGRTISLEAICDMVEVFNSLGVKVAEYRNVETIDGIEEAGVYVIRVTNDSTVQNCRLIVK